MSSFLNNDELVGSDRSVRSVGSWFALLVVCSLSAFLLEPAYAAPLDTKIEAFKNAGTQTENAVVDVLKTGLAENRSAAAYAAVNGWLAANPSESQALLFYAGRVAEYAGEWNDAVSFYRKLVKQKSINEKLAADVVPAIYRLLINHLKDENAAYLFMREDGNRLRRYGRARQFDSWFLEEAARREDWRAMAERLAVVYASETDVSDYTAFMQTLETALETFEKRNDTTVEALDKLASVTGRHHPTFKARWEWINAVTDYNTKAQKVDIKREQPDRGLLDAPIKAAKALMALDPLGGAPFIAKGWSRWNQGDTPTFFRYVHVHNDLKGSIFVEALSRLSVDDAKKLLRSGTHCPKGRWVPVSGFLAPEHILAVVPRFPAIFNALDAPELDLWQEDMTVEDAKTLAPHLAKNPNLAAAWVRALAACGSHKITEMMPVLMKTERWRFENSRAVVERTWHARADVSGANFNEMVKAVAPQDGQLEEIKKNIGKDAPAKTRLAIFNKLYRELQTTPQTPAILWLWSALIKNSPDADRVEMLKRLVNDFIAAQPAAVDLQKHILSRSIREMEFGNAYSQFSFGPEYDGGWDRWGHNNMRKRLPEFARFLGELIKKQAQSGSITPEIFGMWLHCVNPDEDAMTLMKSLVKLPAYKALGKPYHHMAAHRLVFGELAIIEREKDDPRTVSRELLNLPDNPNPQQVEQALKAVLARAGQAHKPVPIFGLQKVARVTDMTPTARKLALELFNRFAPLGDYPPRQGYEALAVRLIKDMRDTSQWGDIEPYVADLWRSADAVEDVRDYKVAKALAGFAAAALAAENPSAALSVARSGLSSERAALNASNTSHDNPAERRMQVRATAGKAALALGVSEVPVDATHPDYPLYKSNAEFILGNVESAWELYVQHADRLVAMPESDETPLLHKLPVSYSFWLLNRSINEGLMDNAEALVKALTIWSRQTEGTFSLEQEGLLKIAYADLAFMKGALPTARAWYRKVADAREYNGSPLYVRAALGSVKIDRVSKNFGSALEELDRLMRVRTDDARKQIHYARAEVMMDQENYKDALDEVESVLRSDPNHADALILRGKIHFEMRKLVEATEIELGVSQENKVIVPGETLKINLLDPTLSVSGVSADIEVAVAAKSGDRERLMLHQVGDSKDKFRAEVPTELGPPVPGDKKLQILGVDEIRYGYSPEFRAKMKDLPPDPNVVISVASDAHLSISAGAFAPREGERRLDIEELGLSTAQQALGTRSVRPGNPVYLRVIDADQSKTAGVDVLPVSLATSSGDIIRRVELKETGPYTGEFEAIVPTAGAQAMAFASERAPGRDPNLAISPGQTAGWQGEVGDKERLRTFGVDLNDNVMPDKLSLRWGEGESAPTRFVLQTSLNGRDWVTRSRYPAADAPWDGRPRVSSFPTYGVNALAVSKATSFELPADWLEKMELVSVRANVAYASAYVENLSALTDKQIVNASHPGYSILMQYKAVFYQASAAIRRFELTGYSGEQTIFLLDGKPAPEDAENPLYIERELAPGLHEIQIWRHASKGDLLKPAPVLLCDVSGQAELTPCPPDMFDPKTFPEGVQRLIDSPATITRAEDNGVDASFGAETRMRLFRIVIAGFQGVAPVVKSVALIDREGSVRLPVKQDFMTLRQNSQLEVLPGDRITVRYEDPVTATPDRGRHEQKLTVAFNDAAISVSFVEFEIGKDGDRELKFEPIRRFRHDDAILVVINDPDMDGSPERDQIDFTVVTSGGTDVKQRAVETEVHSGQFIGRIFPVKGTPSRASEIQIEEGGTLTAIYRDAENLDPGIPTDRRVTVEHAKYVTPELGAYTISSTAIPVTANKADTKPLNSRSRGRSQETVLPRQALSYAYVEPAEVAKQNLTGVIGASLRFDVIAPHLAFAGSSELTTYVQVETNRTIGAQAFDIMQAGTLKVTARPVGADVDAAAGYNIVGNPVPPSNRPPLDEGRFGFSVPLILDEVPQRSFATRDAEELPSSMIPEGLSVKLGDTVKVGFAWKDMNDKILWRTARYKVVSHAFLDVMNDSYSEALNAAYVGEKVFVRLIAYGLDRGPERDRAQVGIQAITSGASTVFNLRETEPHSGIFKGVFSLSYADGVVSSNLPPVELNGLPVKYGDRVDVSYENQTAAVAVNMGADGTVEPFSKRFTGDEMAVQTSFTLAECFFELAKKHRKMDQESLARREMAHAQKLLSEAIATHTDNDLRAHAEYLLGNLSQEYADLSKNDAAKLPMYQEALSRFSKIPVDYPETEFASKSQFKIALVYEKMNEMEIAVEEYVKLAYKYPDSEHIPEVMSRLGGYFQKKGQVFKEQADPLREKTDLQSQAEVLRLDGLSFPEFLRAARIFGQLQERFPDHQLAGLAGLRCAQNYMRAHQYNDAIEAFERVYNTEDYGDKDIRAQAIYWSGLSYERMGSLMEQSNWRGRGETTRNAYQLYRRVTYDFPDSKWAKFARGRLSDPVFNGIIAAENKERERMLEGLKESRKRR